MDGLNKKVTDHRRKMLTESEKVQKSIGKKKKRKKTDEEVVSGANENTWSKKPKKGGCYGGQSGVFLSLDGAGGSSALDDSATSMYGPGGDEDEWTATTKSKNRKGQRARRAKAQAIEAKSKGKSWNSSVNWREKKDKRPEEEEGKQGGGGNNSNSNSNSNSTSYDNGSGNSGSSKQERSKKKAIKQSDIAEGGKGWKNKNTQHPSWLAKQSAATSNIAEFKVSVRSERCDTMIVSRLSEL